ncbi:MAG: MaoC/PaaZ C-terminal domain-containing protein, partial [Ardenticatenaceae bacterium]
VFTVQDLEVYAALTGDSSAFYDGQKRLAIPGPLLGGMFSDLLGTHLPGQGTNYLKQRVVFPTPAYAGEELTATVEIVRLRPEKALVNLRTLCTNPTGQLVWMGEALVLARDVPPQVGSA